MVYLKEFWGREWLKASNKTSATTAKNIKRSYIYMHDCECIYEMILISRKFFPFGTTQINQNICFGSFKVKTWAATIAVKNVKLLYMHFS